LLNWTEPEFAALRYFALSGTDHPHPRLARRDDRRLHALAQRPRPAEELVQPNHRQPGDFAQIGCQS
jgi:hypothetical protein